MNAPTGSTVTAELNGKVTQLYESGGVFTCKLDEFGTYTVRATLGDKTASTTVAVTEAKDYTVTLAYTFTVNGSTNATVGSPNAYVTIGGTTYGAAASQWRGVPNNVVVQPNTNIVGGIECVSSGGEPSRVYLNNQLLAQTYNSTPFTFTVSGNVNIQWTADSRRESWTLNITMN